MKRWKKIVLIAVSAIVVLIVCLLSYLSFCLPDVGPAPDLKVDRSPARVARGRYLAHAVAVCMDCHSARDWSRFSGPLIPSTLGQGGEVFDQKFGFPGSYVSKNLTPYHLGDWTDGEIYRAITSGVNKDGKALFPVMPHPAYGQCDPQDIEDIIAYLRTLKPIKKDVAESKSDFPMNFIINTIPTRAEMSKRPAKADKVAYGKYLATMAACAECHTKQEKGKKLEGMFMAGGFEFPAPNGTLTRSANLTPDKETGIGNWTEEAFVARFKMYADSSYVPPKVGPASYTNHMPWTMYAQMTREDLAAIYAYLQSLPPVNNKVVIYDKVAAK